jgi:hypothetical protein
MKKIITITALIFVFLPGQAQIENLANTTIGLGTGISLLNGKSYDYSLDPGSNNLVVQKLYPVTFVISSIITIKFHDLSTQLQGKDGKRARYFVRTGDWQTDKSGVVVTENTQALLKPARWTERLAFNIGLNLAEISSENISFNKQIDGGIGLGYFVSPSIQVAGFFEVVRTRQMREYIINQYGGKPIPKGNEFYNALDPSDNNLFFNKTFTGFSIKVVIAINPKKNSTY